MLVTQIFKFLKEGRGVEFDRIPDESSSKFFPTIFIFFLILFSFPHSCLLFALRTRNLLFATHLSYLVIREIFLSYPKRSLLSFSFFFFFLLSLFVSKHRRRNATRLYRHITCNINGVYVD